MSIQPFALALAVASFCASCAPLATFKAPPPPVVISPESAARLNQARATESRDPLQALGDYLAEADRAEAILRTHPRDDAARRDYNFAVARGIALIEKEKLDPWSHPVRAGNYTLSGDAGARPDRDPRNFDLVPADFVHTDNPLCKGRALVDGLGAPLCAIGRRETPDFHRSFAEKRTYGCITGYFHFHGDHAEIAFIEPLAQERTSLDGNSYPVAADFNSPLAIMLLRERPDKLGMARLLRPEAYSQTARLIRLQTYDPHRIPVLFVHGLDSTPATWAPMVNGLRANAAIRRRYQFWVYSYPSGYPFPYTASLLRKELDDVARGYPHHQPIVLVGHSMGGMVSRLLVTDAGNRIWLDYFGSPPEQTPNLGASKQILEDALVFNHQPDIQRVIFISTPHRGSNLATFWGGRLMASLVKPPKFLADLRAKAPSVVRIDPAAVRFNRIPNGIDTLSPSSHFVHEMNKFPIAPGIPYHSIMGDRGRGDTPNSSDGVVPYWSSHLDGAQSELIVPAHHGAHETPEAIAEVARILQLAQQR